jgi:ubiquitin-conjugating enzyme E2 variant
MHVLATLALTLAELFATLLAADFLSGLLHWAEDTWLAPGHVAWLDRYVIADNIEHHRRPGSIRGGTYWGTNRVSLLGASALAATAALCGIHFWQVYATLLFVAHANHVHMWAHSSERPRVVRWLQRTGLMQSRGHHGRHHISPYAERFCAMTDFVNPILDRSGFWRGLEWTFERLGARVQRTSPARFGY